MVPALEDTGVGEQCPPHKDWGGRRTSTPSCPGREGVWGGPMQGVMGRADKVRPMFNWHGGGGGLTRSTPGHMVGRGGGREVRQTSAAKLAGEGGRVPLTWTGLTDILYPPPPLGPLRVPCPALLTACALCVRKGGLMWWSLLDREEGGKSLPSCPNLLLF